MGDAASGPRCDPFGAQPLRVFVPASHRYRGGAQMKPLTRRQVALLHYLRSCAACPSFAEMREALSLRSNSGIYRLVSALEERGYVRRIRGRARAIELVERPEWEPPEAAEPVHTLTILDDWCERRAGRLGAISAQHLLGGGSVDDPHYRALVGEHRAYLAMRSFIHGSRAASGIGKAR